MQPGGTCAAYRVQAHKDRMTGLTALSRLTVVSLLHSITFKELPQAGRIVSGFLPGCRIRAIPQTCASR